MLKFQQVRPAAAVLGRMVAETIADLEKAMPVGMIAVVPVPLHKRKQAQRGFNQAEMIARSALKNWLGRNDLICARESYCAAARPEARLA